MSMSAFAWLQGIVHLLAILFYLAAIVFLLSRRRQYTRAVNRALLGMAIIFLGQIAMPLGSFLISISFGTQPFFVAQMLLSLIVQLSYLVGLALLISAVFVDRSVFVGAVDQDDIGFGRDESRRTRDSKNPYAV